MEAKTYLNRFRIITGQTGLPIRVVGGAGERTYKAEDTTTGEAVALELVPAGGLRPELLRQLEAEAASAKQINHINIPKLYDFGFENEHLVYASELFDGTTAEAWVTTHGPLAVGATLRIAQQVVAALGAATFHGIVHHAINPKNIIIVPGQTTDGAWPLIKVLNFVGVAPEVTAADAGALSTAHFASPEQLESGNVDFRSELYSLGKTLSFLLTGSALGPGAQNVERARGIPASVKELIAQMVANNPTDRPLDPLAFQHRIQDLIAQVDRRDNVATKFGVAPAQPVVKDRTARPLPAFFKPLAWAALLLTIATIAGLAIAASMRSGGGVAKNDKPIGVPIGVPQATTSPVTVAAAPTAPATVAAAAPSIAPTAAPASEALSTNNNAGAVAANRPVLTSDPDPTAPVDTAAPSAEPAAPADAQQSNQLASNANAPATTSRTEPAADRPTDRSATTAPPRVVASNNQASPAEQPMPPGAGPDEPRPQGLPAEISETANSYAVARPNNNSDNNRSSEPAEAAESERSSTETSAPKTVRQKSEPTTVASAATPRPKKSSSAAAAPKRTRSGNEQIAAARPAMPPIPRGAVRAEYLGTTPDGNLVFGLPSEQRGYVAPERRRRSRRPPPELDALPAEPAVLPALPPDDE